MCSLFSVAMHRLTVRFREGKKDATQLLTFREVLVAGLGIVGTQETVKIFTQR